MSEKNNEIIDIFITLVRNAGNSVNMEKYGLNYLLKFLTKRGLRVDMLTTDQHIQIRAFLKKDYPNICHQYDIWHRVKNIRKKLEKILKKMAFQEIMPWIRAIANHFWWCCSNCGNDVAKLKDMWTSILFHIRDIHHWSESTSGSSYTSCAHLPLTIRDKVAKKWLDPSSPAYSALEIIVLDARLLNDLPYLVHFKHTGMIEVYHNELLKYCPKRVSFTYKGICARTQLTVLDHNSNLDRKQATTKTNELREKVQFSKVTKQWIVRKVMEKKSNSFVQEILQEIPIVKSGVIENNENIEDAPKTISTTPRPEKKDIVLAKKSRFRKDSQNPTV